MHKLDLEPGDVVLLCSDGLTGMLANARIAAILEEEREPQQACARLVAEANSMGGTDNITVVVGCFADP
jgi:protein phosphatase